MTFQEELHQLSKKYKLYRYSEFNIFKVMFKLHDEKYLHSRFIAFLLDPKGSHGQGTLFLELFLQVMKIPNYNLEGVTVNPNELDRSEKYNIDILIKNKNNQAIIIENKVFAKDQTKVDDEDVINNQLLKYQLTRYYWKLLTEKTEVYKMIYLTIDSKYPEDYGNFPIEVQLLIDRKDHISDIAKWLDLCLLELHTDSDLKINIEQYKQARFEFLNDAKLALRLKDLTATNLEEAKQFWFSNNVDPNLKIVQDQFKHVKWHTVHEFYFSLKHQIEETFNVAVSEIDNEDITKTTHFDKKNATSITFVIEDIIYYVCNDKNGFSIGRHVYDKTAADFKKIRNENYSYFDFKRDEVFELIDPKETGKVVGEIVYALKVFINK